MWTQIGGPAATIVDPTNMKTEVINLIAGKDYTFRIYTTCGDGALTYQDVTHKVNAISIANAGTPATYCPGIDAGTLTANTVGPDESGQWIGSGTNGITINDLNKPNSTVNLSDAASGSATLRWVITNNVTHCSSFDDVIITNRGGVTAISAGAQQILDNCYSSTQSTTLDGSYAGSGIDGQIGVWSVLSGPNGPTFDNINLRCKNRSKSRK